MSTAQDAPVGRTGIQISGIAHAYGDVAVLNDIDLSVEAGRVLALCGPSGCGKSTLLRLVAGLDEPSKGSISIDGEVLTGPNVCIPPEQRGVGLVFQDGALFEHLTVARNVGFGLPRGQRTDSPRIDEMLELVGMSALRDRFPSELSGGQRQRVALARALARSPKALLLDEPFASLDAISRRSMRTDLLALLAQSATTTILVTHDREEACALGDSLAVMSDGRIVQVGPPAEVYARPMTSWIGTFMGDLNRIAAEPPYWPGLTAGAPGRYAVRPEFVRVTSPTAGAPIARVAGCQFNGSTTDLLLKPADQPADMDARLAPSSGDSLVARILGRPVFNPGDTVSVHIDPTEILRFPAELPW